MSLGKGSRVCCVVCERSFTLLSDLCSLDIWKTAFGFQSLVLPSLPPSPHHIIRDITQWQPPPPFGCSSPARFSNLTALSSCPTKLRKDPLGAALLFWKCGDKSWVGLGILGLACSNVPSPQWLKHWLSRPQILASLQGSSSGVQGLGISEVDSFAEAAGCQLLCCCFTYNFISDVDYEKPLLITHPSKVTKIISKNNDCVSAYKYFLYSDKSVLLFFYGRVFTNCCSPFEVHVQMLEWKEVMLSPFLSWLLGLTYLVFVIGS